MPVLLEETFALKKTLLFVMLLQLQSSRSVHRNMWNIDGVDSNYNLLLNDNFDTAYTLNTNGCTISKLEPGDHTLKKLIHYPSNIEWCPAKHHPLLKNNETHIWIVSENFSYYNIKIKASFTCCYRSFYQSWARPNEIVYLECLMFNETIEVSNEFIEVECNYDGKVIHRQYFLFVVKVRFTEKQELLLSLTKNNTFNVIIMGFSSVSRLSAHRTMPKTFDLMKKLGAVELSGYHVVGGGFLDNVMPILTSIFPQELNVTSSLHIQSIFNSYPFIWEKYKDAGFVTAVIHDTAQSQLFDSNLYGFRKKLPDYNIQHFFKESGRNDISWHEKMNEKKLFSNNVNLSNSSETPVCLEDEYYFHLILKYVKRLAEVTHPSRLFGLFWESSLCHSLNAPVLMDDGYEKLIRSFNETGYLNETVLILLSDEGMPHGEIQTTKQGRLEQRLPLASILMPPVFRDEYNVAYKTLEMNRDRLTTPFDLHATLIDLIDLKNVENNAVIRRNKNKLSHERGSSLFLSIPSNRTCESTGIQNNWCTCHQRRKINVKHKLAKTAAKHVLNHVNWLLRFSPQCAKLKVERVIEFEELWPTYRKEIEWREFRLEMRVMPGAGEYEALLRREDHVWALMARIRRLDVYNKPDDCSSGDDDSILSYCQCQVNALPLNDLSDASIQPTV